MGWNAQKAREIFKQLYEKYADKILNYVYFIIKNKADAQELAQEAFLRLYKNIDKYDEKKAKWQTWLYTIARNLSYDYLKHKRYEPDRSLDEKIAIGDDKKELISLVIDQKEEGACKALEKKEIKEIVHSAIKLLPDQYREVIMLCDMHSMVHEEVASLLECSVNAVNIRLNRARRRLGEIIRSAQQE